MVYYYIDTSVLVKRYKSEKGTEFADHLMEVLNPEKNVVATSALTLIEMVSVL